MNEDKMEWLTSVFSTGNRKAFACAVVRARFRSHRYIIVDTRTVECTGTDGINITTAIVPS